MAMVLVVVETLEILNTEVKYILIILFQQSSEKRGPIYNFKFSLAIPNLSMSSIIKGAEKKIEIWIIGQSDVYSLEAKTKKAKEDFANELRRVIIEQKDKAGLKPNSNNSNTGKFPLLLFPTRT